MTHSPYKYSARVRRPNHLPVIFNTARLKSASARVRRLAQTVLHLYVYCLLLLLALRSCVQLVGHTALAVKSLVTGWRLVAVCVLCSLCRTVHPLTLWLHSACMRVTAEDLFTTYAVECAHMICHSHLCQATYQTPCTVTCCC